MCQVWEQRLMRARQKHERQITAHPTHCTLAFGLGDRRPAALAVGLSLVDLLHKRCPKPSTRDSPGKPHAAFCTAPRGQLPLSFHCCLLCEVRQQCCSCSTSLFDISLGRQADRELTVIRIVSTWFHTHFELDTASRR
jgi:hypothetical protein